MPPQDDSALERMRSRLYAPQGSAKDLSRTPLASRRTIVPRGWQHDPAPEPMLSAPRKKLPLSVRFLIGAAGFFVLALLVAGYFLFLGGNAVSTNNVAITIDGPTTIAGGDTVSLLVTIENKNPVALSNTSMTASFPEGTRSADDVTQPLPRYTDTLGDVASGQAVTRTVRAVLFGAENQTVTIPVSIEYQTANSNAVFVKEQDYTVTISTSPVSITATSVSEISSGQPFTISLLVRSNAAKPLSDVAVKATYPFGFAITSTSIPSQNGLFSIGTLAPGDSKTLTISGSLTGADSDERVFHWDVGSTASSTNGAIGVTYSSTESDVSIAQPFLNLTLNLTGVAADGQTVAGGSDVQGTLHWTNTLTSPILNAAVTVALTGNAYDPSSVRTQNGFYQSSNGTITFDSNTNDALANLQPGDTGTGSFSFIIKSASQLAALKSPTVTLSVSASGRRVSESGVPETLSSTITRTLKITGGLSLTSHIEHTVGPFTDTGPWPPVSGTPTQYTVALTAANAVNTVAGATVTMTLPSYVTFTGLTNPADGSITYNSSSHTVKWVVGDMNAGVSKQAAFQISFLPSSSQKGSSPTLVSGQSMTATDRFTQTTVTTNANDLNTQAQGDPGYQNNDGIVQ